MVNEVNELAKSDDDSVYSEKVSIPNAYCDLLPRNGNGNARRTCVGAFSFSGVFRGDLGRFARRAGGL